jgi:hypothetical protein
MRLACILGSTGKADDKGRPPFSSGIAI